MKKYAVLSLSGGLDSSTLLLHLLANDYEVQCISMDYGQKHKIELEKATELVSYLNGCSQKFINGDLGEGIYHNFHPVKHKIIKLDGLSELLNSSLVEGGNEVPEGHYKEENMRESVVPNRNKIFSSIIQAVALSLSTKDLGDGQLEKRDVKIALGIHAGDHSIYPDCRKEFRDADMEAFRLGNWDADLVQFYTPYLEVNKFEILQDGEKCCQELGLDFNEVYKRTLTSYKPIWIGEYDSMNQPSERTGWYSDYKSASSVERIEAFIKLDRPDPIKYADEKGPVSWETASNYVIEVLDNYQSY